MEEEFLTMKPYSCIAVNNSEFFKFYTFIRMVLLRFLVKE